MRCGNSKCDNDAIPNGVYCSAKCGQAVRARRYYRRKKKGVQMVDCPECGGTGMLETGNRKAT